MMGLITTATAPFFGITILLGAGIIIWQIWERRWHANRMWNLVIQVILMLVAGSYLGPAGWGYVHGAPTGVGILNNIAGTVGGFAIAYWISQRREVRARNWARALTAVLFTGFLFLVWQGTVQQIRGGSYSWPSLTTSSVTSVPSGGSMSTHSGDAQGKCDRGEYSFRLCNKLEEQGKIH